MARNLSLWLIALPVVFISACASDPNSCDPRNPGFISGISAMASGCYEQRVSSKRAAVDAEESYSRSLSAEKNQLASQKRLTSKQKSQAQGKLAAVQARNNELEARLQHMDTNTSSAQAEKERLSMQLAQSKKDVAVLKRKIESEDRKSVV